MSQCLLLIFVQAGYSRLLSQWLGGLYQTIVVNPESTSERDFNTLITQHFPLCILALVALNKFASQIQAKKNLENSTFLSLLLVTSREDIEAIASYPPQTIDELIFMPLQ